MIIGTLITLTAIAAISGFLYGVWRCFVDFAEEIIKAAHETLKKFANFVFAGVKCFVKKAGNSIKEIIKAYTYNKDRDRWTVTTSSREIPPDQVEKEIPADIRARVKREQKIEHDVTENVELKVNYPPPNARWRLRWELPNSTRTALQFLRWPSYTLSKGVTSRSPYGRAELYHAIHLPPIEAGDFWRIMLKRCA